MATEASTWKVLSDDDDLAVDVAARCPAARQLAQVSVPD
jgi:hypothetical protein